MARKCVAFFAGVAFNALHDCAVNLNGDGVILGAQIVEYLLEQSRVVDVSEVRFYRVYPAWA